MVYESKQNPLIKKIASLKDKKGRREHGAYLVEGIKMVFEAVKYNQPICYVVITEGFKEPIPPCDAEVITVSRAVFEYLSDETTPQGILAVIKIPSNSVQKPIGNALLLDGVSDPGNLGTIIRTACASGYKDIYAVNSADFYSPKTVRASMSGIYFVNLYKCSYEEVFSVIDGLDLIVADIKGSNLFEFKPSKNFCIAVGNEANGLSKTVKDKASYTLTIPMSENSESLNVAVASSIMMYTLINQKEN